MSPLQETIINFQNLVAQVPEIIQPFIVMLAGAVPFIEGEVASMVGLVGGLHPIVAALAAAAGNFISVALVVFLTSQARMAVVNRRRSRVGAMSGAGAPMSSDDDPAPFEEAVPAKPDSKGRLRFKRWLVRYGVPGASILGPLAIPTQVTASILVGGGTPRGWVLLWQAVAIVLWTTVSTISIWAALTFLVGV
ncbi:small multidrug efflux protein [Salinibacterium sp. dk2585]|uniref:small multidrug efflux protein n=1 Tax=unclassified Salinibacterium TaxID=2632331 RepID=UPI0011C24620|nr:MULTISPECIES: small multidrug efflux protein [unclassified Salinibacterium]QEE61002.1 small multidrug efflux protein [Salinibacterium sp. dk2585]TXK52944.1 small multidrug efflux protein [Salinibacterium sp. dk5596]